LYRKDQYRGPVEAELLGEGERGPTKVEHEQTREQKAYRAARKKLDPALSYTAANSLLSS